MFRAYLQIFWGFCRFRGGPDALPYSVPHMILLVTVNIVMGWYQFSHQSDSSDALFQAVLLMAVLASFTYIVLHIKQMTARFVQTLTALAGINIVINAFVYPIIFIYPYLPRQPTTLLTAIIAYSVVFYMLFLNIWLILTTGYVYSRTLEVSYLVGVLVAIALLGSHILIFSPFIA